MPLYPDFKFAKITKECRMQNADFRFFRSNNFSFFNGQLSRYSLYLLRQTLPQEDTASIGAKSQVLVFYKTISKKIGFIFKMVLLIFQL
jgi:hypothetical protein